MMKNFEDYKDQYLRGLKDSSIKEAMIYVLDGGKRFRTKLMFSIIKGHGLKEELGFNSALALEMIHAYSLVHDDLPCMDDDDLRRGKASCHVAFGEAQAVLCGDALLTEAFRIITKDKDLSDSQKIKIIEAFSELAGVEGMIYGQYLDLLYEGRNDLSKDIIFNIDKYKTSCLFKAALYAAMYICDDIRNKSFYDELAIELGIIFQMQDDLFDILKSSEEMGKPSHSDDKNKKATILKFYSIEELKKEINNKFSYIIELVKTRSFENKYILELIDELEKR